MTKKKNKSKWNPLDLHNVGQPDSVPPTAPPPPVAPIPLPGAPSGLAESSLVSRTIADSVSDSNSSCSSKAASTKAGNVVPSTTIRQPDDPSRRKALKEIEGERDLPASPNKQIGDKPSFASLFRDNRKLTADRKLEVFSDIDDEFQLNAEDVCDINKDWGFCLVGYVAGKLPGWKALKALCDSWRVSYKMFIHNGGKLIFRLESEED